MTSPPGIIIWLVQHQGFLVLAPILLAVIFIGLRTDSSHPHNES